MGEGKKNPKPTPLSHPLHFKRTSPKRLLKTLLKKSEKQKSKQLLVYWANSSKCLQRGVKTTMSARMLKDKQWYFSLTATALSSLIPPVFSPSLSPYEAAGIAFYRILNVISFSLQSNPTRSSKASPTPSVSAAPRQQQPVSRDILIPALCCKWDARVGHGSKTCQ